jgi:hypothetical protein
LEAAAGTGLDKVIWVGIYMFMFWWVYVQMEKN